MTSRSATHSGTWYSDSGRQLDGQLGAWLDKVDLTQADIAGTAPLQGLKAIIAPHAGYSYSGPPAAWSYKAINPDSFDRVFILGPSHHKYIDGCALTRCLTYQTPLGDLSIDQQANAELKATGRFEDMPLSVDEDEHSIEMHLPYLRKVFQGKDVKIVPILVGSISFSKEAEFGTILAKYLLDPRTLFVISSDFCHWGSRFSYTYYKSSPSDSTQHLRRSSSRPSGQPIYQSIEALDRDGMSNIAFSAGSTKTIQEAHSTFGAYLKETKNTICGRHPIGVLLAAAATLQANQEPAWQQGKVDLQFVRYEQSSQCITANDSSVSYASAVLRSLKTTSK